MLKVITLTVFTNTPTQTVPTGQQWNGLYVPMCNMINTINIIYTHNNTNQNFMLQVQWSNNMNTNNNGTLPCYTEHVYALHPMYFL